MKQVFEGEVERRLNQNEREQGLPSSGMATWATWTRRPNPKVVYYLLTQMKKFPCLGLSFLIYEMWKWGQIWEGTRGVQYCLPLPQSLFPSLRIYIGKSKKHSSHLQNLLQSLVGKLKR